METSANGAQEPLLVSQTSGQQAILDFKRNASCILADGCAPENAHESKVRRKLLIALALCFIFMIVEVAGGIIAHSLAVLTDAAHLLADVSGFAVSAFAGYWATRKSMNTHTFGYHRVEVLGALASVLSIWLVTGVLLYEAVDRVLHPVPVDGKIMFFVALAGVAVNALIMAVLGHSHAHAHGHSHAHGHDEESACTGAEAGGGDNINMRGAMLHVIGDFVQSIGVTIAGALIWWKQNDARWAIADPICTFVFAILVLLTTRAILRDISDILMERVPRAICVDTMEDELTQIEGVGHVRDLHVWALKPGMVLLAAHVDVEEAADPGAVLLRTTQYCRQLGIDHTTIQIDTLLPSTAAVTEALEDGHSHGHSHSHKHACSGHSH